MTQAVKTDWAGRESALARCCNERGQQEPLVAWDGLLDGWLVVFQKALEERAFWHREGWAFLSFQ